MNKYQQYLSKRGFLNLLCSGISKIALIVTNIQSDSFNFNNIILVPDNFVRISCLGLFNFGLSNKTTILILFNKSFNLMIL